MAENMSMEEIALQIALKVLDHTTLVGESATQAKMAGEIYNEVLKQIAPSRADILQAK